MDRVISFGVHNPVKAYYNVHTVWLVMMLLTLSTYVLGELGEGGFVVVVFILGTAMLKGSFIIRDFMELKGVSMLWKVLMYGWLWTICITITVTYIVSA